MTQKTHRINIILKSVGDKESARLMRKYGKDVADTDKKLQKLNKTVSVTKSSLRTLVSPLNTILKVSTAYNSTLTTLALSTVKITAKYQSYKIQLQAVLRTQQAANKAFEESKSFADITPFKVSDIVNARIQLEALGVTGENAVRAAAEGAAARGKSVSDVVSAIGALRPQSLKRLGITLHQRGEEFKIQYRDANNELVTILANGAIDARKSLLAVMQSRFSGATEALSNTISGAYSTLQDAIRSTKFDFGSQFTTELTTAIKLATKFIKSIDLEDEGKAFANQLERGTKGLTKAFLIGGDVFKAIAQASEKGKLGDVVISSFEFGAKIAGNTIIEYFRLSANIWLEIGKLIGNGFNASLADANIPILSEAVKRGQAGQVTAGLRETKSIAEIEGIASDMGLNQGTFEDFKNTWEEGFNKHMNNMFSPQGNKLDAQLTRFRENILAKIETHLATNSAETADLAREMYAKEAGDAIKGIGDEIGESVERLSIATRDDFKEYLGKLEKASGFEFDTPENYKKRADALYDAVKNGVIDGQKIGGGLSIREALEGQGLDDGDVDIQGGGEGNEWLTNLTQSGTDWVKGLGTSLETLDQQAGLTAKNFEKVFTNAFENLTDVFVNFFTTGELDFKKFINTVSSELLRMATQALMIKAIIGIGGAFAGGGANSAVQSAYSGAVDSTASVTATSTFAGGPSMVPMRAVGGPVTAGLPFIAGENGPELVTTNKNANVLTSEQTSAMVGDSGGNGELRIINVTDPSMVGSYMESSEGQQTFLNNIGRNATEIRRKLGMR